MKGSQRACWASSLTSGGGVSIQHIEPPVHCTCEVAAGVYPGSLGCGSMLPLATREHGSWWGCGCRCTAAAVPHSPLCQLRLELLQHPAPRPLQARQTGSQPTTTMHLVLL